MITNYNFLIAFTIFILGIFAIITSKNLIKKLLALGIFQASVLLFYVSLSKIHFAKIPILKCLNFDKCPEIYANPLPHILMLTAIVVGVASLAVGLAIIIRIKESLGTIDESEIDNMRD